MIESTRLKIRPWTSVDASAFYDLTQDKGFNLFPITIYKQPDLESAQQWVDAAATEYAKTSFGKFAVVESRTNLLIGMGGLTPWKFDNEEMIDVTYRLKESAWGCGYGREMAVAIVRHAFETLQLSELTATITPDNTASQNIANHLGMVMDRQIILKSVPTILYRLRR